MSTIFSNFRKKFPLHFADFSRFRCCYIRPKTGKVVQEASDTVEEAKVKL